MKELAITLPDGAQVRKTADKTAIYGLVDPVTNEIRYVGKANCPTSRLKGHLSQAKRRGKTAKEKWLNSLNKLPQIVILGYCSDSQWPELEIRWIELCGDMNASLTNIGKGGEGMRHGPIFFAPDYSRAAELGCSPADLEELIDFHQFGHLFGGMSEGAMHAYANLIDRLPDASRIDLGIRALAKASRLRTGTDVAPAVFAATKAPHPKRGLLTVTL